MKHLDWFWQAVSSSSVNTMQRTLLWGIVIGAGWLASGCTGAPAPGPPPSAEKPAPGAVHQPADDQFVPEEGFERLTLADFEPFQGEAGSWHEENGVIICRGTPKGYVHTLNSYDNFTWRGEYRFVPREGAAAEELEKSNTGFMIHIQQPHKVWPRSLEVQGRFDEICSIKSNGGVPELTIRDDPQARAAARNRVGEWNAVEIVSRGGALTSFLNGQKICESEPGELKAGPVGLQSELYEVHFRRLRIRRDP